MKILLIYSNIDNFARFKNRRTEFPPIGLLYLASAIDQNKHEVSIIEFNHKIDFPQSSKYDIIGLNINTAISYKLYKANIKLFHSTAQYIIAGGQFATNYYSLIFKELKITAIVRGEGEKIINNLIEKINIINSQNISGVVSAGNIYESSIQRIKDLNQIEPPARHLLRNDKILLNHRVPNSNINSINIITSRGCPYNCAFCGNIYKKVTYRSNKNLKIELINLIENYQINHITVLDENLMLSKKHLIDVCNAFCELNLKWTCNARVDSYSDDKISIMQKSGCLEIKYGIESGDESILRLMNKKITIPQIKKAIIGTKRAGIRTKGFLIFGFPSENIHSINKTLELLIELKTYLDRVNLFNFVPFHNSLCHKFPEKYGITLSKEYFDYSFYSSYKNWWGTKEEYNLLMKHKIILDDYIKLNFENNEPINENQCII